MFGVYAFDLIEDQLENRFLKPYRSGGTIVTGGETVDVHKITKIRISETAESASSLRSAAEREREYGRSAWTSTDAILMTYGRERTDDFITAPPGSAPEQTVQKDAVEAVVRLCERFPLVARQLCVRGRERTPLTIDDEYDLQYLTAALLAAGFDDIRPEEWTPSYAGGSTKMDFLLKPEKVVLELKRTRD
jgi:hypothetical protein